METPEQNSTLLQVVDVELDVLSYHFQGVSVDDRNVVYHFVFLQLEIVTEILHAFLVFIQA